MKFTIGIPAFKASFLHECIHSVLNQSFPDFELIIINDASPENIDSIINQFNDSRIKYHKNDKNLGAKNVIDNWNKCLDIANGDYFILLGDDDMMCDDYLMECVKAIEKNRFVSVFHCRSYFINSKSEITGITQALPQSESVYEYIWHRINQYRDQFISDNIFKTETLKNIGGFYKNFLAWTSDDVTTFLMAKDGGVVHINKPLLKYRLSNINITSSTKNTHFKMQAIIQQQKWFMSFLKKVPENITDGFFYTLIWKVIDKYFENQKICIIKQSFENEVALQMFYWLTAKKKFAISNKIIFKAYFKYLSKHFNS